VIFIQAEKQHCQSTTHFYHENNKVQCVFQHICEKSLDDSKTVVSHKNWAQLRMQMIDYCCNLHAKLPRWIETMVWHLFLAASAWMSCNHILLHITTSELSFNVKWPLYEINYTQVLHPILTVVLDYKQPGMVNTIIYNEVILYKSNGITVLWCKIHPKLDYYISSKDGKHIRELNSNALIRSPCNWRHSTTYQC